MKNKPILSVTNLQVRFPGFSSTVHAINGCSFELNQGELLGLVGESGCGKSLTSIACLGLLPENAQVSGSIKYQGQELLGLEKNALAKLRGKDIAMIFQNPMTALNPYFTVGQQMMDVILCHQPQSKASALSQAQQVLEKVHLPDAKIALKKYPHQFSGGQLQRIMIAMALSCQPKVLIADEPTTALDVTIQAQIILLLRELAESEGLSVIFITHDLSVVASLCDRVAVMYAGKIVEQSDIHSLFKQPLHPYSQGLLKSVPSVGTGEKTLFSIKGAVPDMRKPPKGCSFAARCHKATNKCNQEQPTISNFNGHQVSCFNLDSGEEKHECA